MKKDKKILIIAIFIIILILILITFFSSKDIIISSIKEKIYKYNNQVEFECKPLKIENNELKVSMKISSSIDTIKRVELPDEDALIINDNRKTIGLDYSMELGKEYKFKVISTSGEELEKIFRYDESDFYDKNKFKLVDNDGLIGKIKGINSSGFTSVEVNGKNAQGEETKQYQLDVIYHEGDLVLDGRTEVEGATLNDNVYEFGDASDVATANTEASRMVVLKVNGNLTIEEGVTITTVKSEENYGGPKGFFIFCDDELNNKGTISMTERGAKATGENVYLWKNSNDSFEYIPAIGGIGGASSSTNKSSTVLNGKNGKDGINRQTRWRRNRIRKKLDI